MAHAGAHGYPVPAVHEAAGDSIVMDRVEGGTLLDEVSARPWRIRRAGRILADLHQRLHAIDAPSSLAGSGALLHGDLHPLNVLCPPSGPIVIDWANASAGEPADDVALTWVLLATGDPGDAGVAVRLFVRLGRKLLLRAFLAAFGPAEREAIRRALPRSIERRRLDRNLTDGERVSLDRFQSRLA